MTFNEVLPYIYGIFSNINFILMQIFFKMLTVVIPPSIVLSFQSFFLLAFNSYIILSNEQYRATYKKYDPNKQPSQEQQVSQLSVQNQDRLQINIKDPHIFRLVLSRLFFNVMGIWILGMALQAVPLSIANSLLNTGPIMIYFIESIFYHVPICYIEKKPLNKLHLLLTTIAFCGVIIIVNPIKAFISSERQQFFHLLLPLIAALVSSMGFIYLHELKGKVSQFVTLQYAYICQTLYFHFLSNLAADDAVILQMTEESKKYFQPSIFDPYCVAAFVLMIVFAYLSHFFRVKSVFRLKPSRIAPFNYIGIILSILIDITVFGHKSSFWEVIGVLLTSVGLLSHFILAIKEGEEKQDKEDLKK